MIENKIFFLIIIKINNYIIIIFNHKNEIAGNNEYFMSLMHKNCVCFIH